LQQMERYPCADGREHITQGGSPVSQWAGLVGTWAAIIVVVAALALLVVWHGARMRRRSVESGGEMGVGR
jgi:hypothetical protein